MSIKKLTTLIILSIIIVQQGVPLTNQLNLNTGKGKQKEILSNNQNVGITKKLSTSLSSTSTFILDLFSSKSEFTLNENIVIIVMLYDSVTQNPIIDSVTVTTPLGSYIIQLTQFVNQITLNKADFLTGLNTITVTYKSQSKSIQILRQNPVTKGSIGSNISIKDILNSQPAPGVIENITYSVINTQYLNFPTETNEYIQVGLTFQGTFLVLVTRYYGENNFIQNNQIKFFIPTFLAFQTYTIQLYYSGDTFLQPVTVNQPVVVSSLIPIITSKLSGTILEISSVLNETASYIDVKTEGYLPPAMHVTITLNGVFLLQQSIESYRQKVALVVPNSFAIGSYTLQALFSYSQSVTPTVNTYQVQVVNKIGLIIRTDISYFTLGIPVLFDFFCYDPATFAGVACNILMMNGTIDMLSMQTSTGNFQQSITFAGLDTAKVYTFNFDTTPVGATNLYQNNVTFKAKFYHNTSIAIQIQKNIVAPTQLISLEADVNGYFTIKDVNNLIIENYLYDQAGLPVNYFITFNNTQRGLNNYEVFFTASNSNYSNVTQQLTLYMYDTITIQSVQTNASFYQLGTWILFQGVATIGNELDSLNNVVVTLLLNSQVVTNTSIQSNDFLFLIPTPNSIGLKNYEIAIYANDSQFILTSPAYEVTVSVINDFGLSFNTDSNYQVGDTVKLQVYGLENRDYSLYFILNGNPKILDNFTYKQIFTYSLQVKTYGHYLIYLKEKTTGDVTYYALNILQNPTVNLQYGILKTFTNNSIKINMKNYQGHFKVKMDNLYQNYNTYYNNESGTTTIQLYNVRSGNHSITILFNNEYTLNKVRTYYVVFYQRIDVVSVSHSSNQTEIHEGDLVTMHLKFKEYSNVSLNDIAIQITTNDQTILAQSNIFNSEADFQLTIIGDNLSLVVVQNNNQYIHQEIIPLNLTVYHLLTTNMQKSYSFNSATTLKISFSYLYFPVPVNLTVNYDLISNSNELSNSSYGQELTLPLNNNGNYNLTVLVTGKDCVNQTFETFIKLQKLFDLSNTGLVTAVAMVIALPVAIVTITVMKKRKTIL